MSINRHAKRRDKTEPDVIKALEQVGAQVWRLDTPCDLLVCFRRRWYLVEVKSSGGKLTEIQQELINKADAPVLVVQSGEDALKQISQDYGGN